jgi:thiol-disulfide isomerase/thioredoxin
MCSNDGIAGSDRWRQATALVATVVILTGCGSPRPADAPPAAADRPAADPSVTIALHLVDHNGLMEEVARHRGKVVVLDCWSTSCPPCVIEFPGLVELAAAHPDRVQCLSLCFDYDGIGAVDDLVGPVKGFLERVGAGDVVNMLATEDADSLSEKLEIVSVPAIFIWKPDGTLAIRYDDDFAARELDRPFTYDDVAATVDRLLAE